MNVPPLVTNCDNTTALCRDATKRIIACLKEGIANNGHATMALAGGSSPIAIYRALAQSSDIDWTQCIFFAGDDRFVPADSPFNNSSMMQKELIDQIPGARFFAIDTNVSAADDAARSYSQTIDDVFNQYRLPRQNDIPVFDVVLLGIGPDGHTASLFPGTNALNEHSEWVTAIPMSGLEPFVPRVTMTYPLINAASHAIILVNGNTKSEIARTVVEHQPNDYPVAGVHSQMVHWFIAP